MKKTQKSQQDMLLRVMRVLIQFESIWIMLRAFVARKNEVQGSLDLIAGFVADQDLIRAGVRPERDRYRSLVIKAALVLAGQIRALARVTKNQQLASRVSVSETSLLEAGLGLAALARNIAKEGADNLEALADFGVTNDQLDELNGLVNIYSPLAATPRDAIKNQGTITRLLESELRTAMGELREFFDPMMLQFETKEPRFFEEYQSARGRFNGPTRAKLDENGQPTAKWRIAKAEKAAAKKANAGTSKSKAGKGSRSATTTTDATTNVTLPN